MESFVKENMTGENFTGEHPNTPGNLLTATTLIGNKVYNNLNEHLGEVKDIMLNVKEGKIEYVVIEFGGFLGIGEKFFAIPIKLLALDTGRHAFILGQRKEVIENAPGFDKDHWPETNSHTWQPAAEYWEGVGNADGKIKAF